MNDNHIKEIRALPVFWGHIIALGFVLKFFDITSILDFSILLILQFFVAVILCGAILFFQYQYANEDQQVLLKKHHQLFFEEKKFLFKRIVFLFKHIFVFLALLLVLIMIFSNLQRGDLIKSTLSFSYIAGVLLYCLFLPLYFYLPILIALKFFVLPSEISSSTVPLTLEQEQTIQPNTVEDELLSTTLPIPIIEDQQTHHSQRPHYQGKKTDQAKPKFPPFPPILVHRKKLLDDTVLLSSKHARLIKQYIEVLDYVEHSIQRVQQQEDKNFIMQTEQEAFLSLQKAITEFFNYPPDERLRYQVDQKRIPDLWLSQFIEQQRQALIIATEKIYHNDVQSLVDHQTFLQQKLQAEHNFEAIKDQS